jgi:hypothetical protein
MGIVNSWPTIVTYCIHRHIQDLPSLYIDMYKNLVALLKDHI